MKRTLSKDEESNMLKPEYINREEEEVIYTQGRGLQ